MSYLYKFVSSEIAVVNMAVGSLKFAPIKELNDPSEMTPNMDPAAVQDSLCELRRNGLSDDQFKWLKCQGATLDMLAPEEKVLNVPKSKAEANELLSLTAYDNLDYMKEKLFTTISLIRSRVGVLSLSERYNSLPMWAHYANNAKGFVVVFDNVKKAFPGDCTGSLNVAKPVGYSDCFTGMTYDPSTQDRLFFSKLSDWSYEREWRVVSPLSSCSRSEDKTLFLKEVDRKHVKAVICGWRVSPEIVSSLKCDLEKKNKDVTIICSTFESGRIQLQGDVPDWIRSN